jgi:hypothetical protein
VTLIRNNQEEFLQNNYIRIKLLGSKLNSQGIGASIWIETEDKTIFQEAYNTRGYLSSSDFVMTVGIGNSQQVKSIRVIWPERRESMVQDVKVNSLVEVSFEGSVPIQQDDTTSPNSTLLSDVTPTSGIDFVYEEDDYNDFGKQKLVHYRLSRLGGKLAVADVNGDDNDDVFFGGASGQSPVLYLGQDDAKFVKSSSQPWLADRRNEDMKPHFFDADGDGDQDLYIVSGGIGFEKGSALYQDRLYINNGKGSFRNMTSVLPSEATSGSCVVTADFDKDGDMDLFVGGRHMGSMYPFSPESFILRNDTEGDRVKFTNVTAQISEELGGIGMVTDAVWTDYNGDSWPDLIVVGEWMKIEIFKNEQGKLVRQVFNSLTTSNGWWRAIKQADVDGDGDMDYLLGNAGTNYQLKATAIEPIDLYAGDYDNDGFNDPIMSYYIQGKSYPFHSRDELLSQLKPLEKRFPSYTSYASATILDFLGPRMLEQTFHLKAYRLSSCWMENKEGTFILHELPEQLQYAPINSFVELDVDGDGKTEFIAAGNFYDYKPQIGMANASMGNILRYSDNQLELIHDTKTPLWIDGNVRDMEVLTFSDDQKRLAVSRNDEPAGIYMP